jgi:Flp pilus assembly protein TadG
MHQLRTNERGAAIIELALVAPIFALMTVGIVDMSNAYSRKLALEQGAQRAIEKIMQTTQGETVDDTLKNEAVCQVNGTNADGTCKSSPITSANVTVTYRLECTDTTTGAVEVKSGVPGTEDCAGNQAQAQYIQVSLTDKYTPMFPLHFGGLNVDGTYHMSASAGMRTQ